MKDDRDENHWADFHKLLGCNAIILKLPQNIDFIGNQTYWIASELKLPGSFCVYLGMARSSINNT